MPLYVVATPIGNLNDISRRALTLLSECDFVIGEEFKEASKLLKFLGLEQKPIEELNEHSQTKDVAELVERCQRGTVVLISDCGTPGFCDPGAELVAACRKKQITVLSVPGPSSLMAFLSVCGQRLTEFWFRGFLPANREERTKALKDIKSHAGAIVLMDTPYRLSRLMTELAEIEPSRPATLGMDLSTEKEKVITGSLQELAKQTTDQKAEFLILLHERSLARKNSR